MRGTTTKFRSYLTGYPGPYLPPFMFFKEQEGSSANGYKYHKRTVKARTKKGGKK